MREAAVALVGVVSPLSTGWILVSRGPRAAFYLTAFFQTLAVIPLGWTPNISIRRKVPRSFRMALPGAWLFFTDGWINAGVVLIWQIALFRTLSENYVVYGSALATAALVAAISALTLGRHIDGGHGKRAVWLALGSLSLLTVLRTLSVGRPASAVIANALGSIVMCLYIPTLMTAVYNQAKRSPCTLRFHVATEGGWDVGCSCACLITAAVVAVGGSLNVGVLLSLVGIAGSLVLQVRYYHRLAVAPG